MKMLHSFVPISLKMSITRFHNQDKSRWEQTPSSIWCNICYLTVFLYPTLSNNFLYALFLFFGTAMTGFFAMFANAFFPIFVTVEGIVTIVSLL